jgi:lipopolysaccharide transport system ATP-binding protein
MKNIVIKAENISKQYRLGEVGTGTLSHDLNRFWYKVRGKDDPYIKIGETNDRSKKGQSDYVWSLRDINFEINQGDAVGIIGRNGAGKSTLLKLLSKVTKPTTGSFKINGRIASLLEVGTGFNPEMTGRENVFLNGAILGMSRSEINRKLDEIIDFSGVERYIDTPVKRYSSGMYVRLAFAVAAHLESEILIVDEVLAVGDAEFQKKCLGKMGDVSKGEGRTVLFVSHNLASVQNLCNRGFLLEKGNLIANDSIVNVLQQYQLSNQDSNKNILDFDRKGSGLIRLSEINLISKDNEFEKGTFFLGEKFYIKLKLNKIEKRSINNVRIIIGIYNLMDEGYLRFDSKTLNTQYTIEEEETFIICDIEEHLNIKPDKYYINVAILSNDVLIDHITNVKGFYIDNSDYYKTGRNIDDSHLAKVYYKHKWL